MLLVLGQDRYLVLLRQKIGGWMGWEKAGMRCWFQVLVPDARYQKGGMYTDWFGEMPSLAALHSVCLSLSRNRHPVLDGDGSTISSTEIRTKMIHYQNSE
jgi:hypothetical protein